MLAFLFSTDPDFLFLQSIGSLIAGTVLISLGALKISLERDERVPNKDAIRTGIRLSILGISFFVFGFLAAPLLVAYIVAYLASNFVWAVREVRKKKE